MRCWLAGAREAVCVPALREARLAPSRRSMHRTYIPLHLHHGRHPAAPRRQLVPCGLAATTCCHQRAPEEAEHHGADKALSFQLDEPAPVTLGRVRPDLGCLRLDARRRRPDGGRFEKPRGGAGQISHGSTKFGVASTKFEMARPNMGRCRHSSGRFRSAMEENIKRVNREVVQRKRL